MFTISLIQSYAVTSGRYIYISCAEIAFVWKCNLLISPHVRCFVGVLVGRLFDLRTIQCIHIEFNSK